VDVLMATQGIARVEAFLALVTVKRARVVVDCLHMVALYWLRLEWRATDLTQIRSHGRVTRLVLRQVCLKQSHDMLETYNLCVYVKWDLHFNMTNTRIVDLCKLANKSPPCQVVHSHRGKLPSSRSTSKW